MVHVSLGPREVVVQERRKYPRVKCAVPIKLVPEGVATAIHASTSDISCGGCYAEMDFTLSVETKVEMTLWLDGDDKLVTHAVVTTNHPYFGNGFKFVDMTVGDLNKLNRYLHKIIATDGALIH